MTDAKDLQEARKFIQDFTTVFLEHSYNNRVFAHLALHLILGRCTYRVIIKKKRLWLDGRISFWYLAPPSSGKSTPYDFIYSILQMLGENRDPVSKVFGKDGIEKRRSFMEDVDDTSDAKLIGYHDEDGNEVVGILDRGGVVHWDEAAMLLGTTQYSEKVKGFLQKALNPIGSESNRCSRDFKSDSVTISPICSLYLTSYIPDGIVEKVLGTGLLQRLLVLPKEMRTEDRKKNSHKDIDFLGEEVTEEDIDISYFAEKFQEIYSRYNTPETKFEWKGVKPLFKSKADQLLGISKESPKKVRNLMETFHPRYMDQMYIIAMHHCCLRGDTAITVDDVNYAYNLIASCYSGILAWLEDEPKIDSGAIEDVKWFNNIVGIFAKEKKTQMSSTELIKHCCDFWGRTEPTVHKRLAPLVQKAEQGGNGLVKTKKGRTVFYSIQKIN